MMFLRGYTPKHFDLRELVSPTLWKKRGPKVIQLLNPYALYSLDTLKEEFPTGTMTINNWYWNGNRKYSGIRQTGDPHFSDTSQHSFGNAFDCIFSDYTAEEVRQYIISNREKFPFITCIEAGVDWLHFDCRNLPQGAPEGAIMIVYTDGTFKYV